MKARLRSRGVFPCLLGRWVSPAVLFATQVQHLLLLCSHQRSGRSTWFSNSVGNVGARALSIALLSLKALELLDLSNADSQYNYPGQPAIEDDGACALAAAFHSLVLLRSLLLSRNRIGPLGARALAGALPNLASLRVLDLGGNLLSDEGASAIFEALPRLESLSTLILGQMQYLMRVLRHFSVRERLA